MRQFIGESLLHVAIAMVVAIMMVELLLPSFSASTMREITRATSSIGSPRERCVSTRFKLIAMPPS